MGAKSSGCQPVNRDVMKLSKSMRRLCMRSLKNRSVGFYVCFGLLLAMAIVGSTIVYADSGTAKVIVKAGNLTPSNVIDQVSLNVNKKDKLINYTLPIAV